MTVAEHRPPPPSIDPDLFARLAAQAYEDDGTILEFIHGRVWLHRVTDSDHSQIMAWMFRQCLIQRADCDLLQGQGLKVETYRKGQALPDGVLVPRGNFKGHKDYPDPDGVLAVVEVTSWDSDTKARDRVEKPAAYAESGIPAYVCVDRTMNAVVVYSRPLGGEYLECNAHPYGEQVAVPGTGVTLDTDELKQFAR
ncbi:Uma2 family endonuclease [Nocardiopsis sp. NPDC050513]|uniref:Uma2 family endonuclease n=1 Tax=Nocardiopsis sp. NPDC050513 TaxID=3364338 RepID=UPI00378D2410